MTDINEPCKRVVSALNGQDSQTLILTAKIVIAITKTSSEPAL